MRQKLRRRIIIILCVLAFMIYELWPLQEHIRLGLDLRGGMYFVLEVDRSNLSEEEAEDAADRALEIIRNRIDEFGVEEPTILKQGDDRIVLQLPDAKEENKQRIIDLIQATAFLEFRLLNDDQELLARAKEGKRNVPMGYELLPMIPKKDASEEKTDFLLVEKEQVITGEALKDAYVDFNQGGFNQVVIAFELNRRGAKSFARATRENTGRFLAIVLDGRVQSAPRIQEEIPHGRGQISGSFTLDEAKDLAIALRAGALPAPIKIIEERSVGATLGTDSINKGLNAALLGIVLVIGFIVVYYRAAGLISIVALLLNVIAIFAALSILKAVLTFPGIAGIILTIGMAIDANVLIFERIREEILNKKSLSVAVQTGYDKAVLTILDANVTTLIGAVVLYYFGSGPIRGFAVTLSIGVIASMVTSIYVTRVFFDGLLVWKPKTKTLSI